MLIALLHKAGTDFRFHVRNIEDETGLFPLPVFGGLFPAAPDLKLSSHSTTMTRFMRLDRTHFPSQSNPLKTCSGVPKAVQFAAAVRKLLKESKDPKFTRVYLAHMITRVDAGKIKIEMRDPKAALAEQAIAFDSSKLLVPTFDLK